MLIHNPHSVPPPQRLNLIPTTISNFSRQTVSSISTSPHVSLSLFTHIPKRKELSRTYNSEREIIGVEAEQVVDDVDEFDEYAYRRQFGGREEEKDYDKDPEFADILGSCFDDPAKAQARTIRSWHIIGRRGGCNSMNMQLSQAPLDKRPSYDPIQGANVTPTTLYNIGDFEVQENLGLVWRDIGTSEPLLLDVLINASTQISSDYIGIKQLVFGGSEFGNWNENLTSEAAGYSVHKI